jgi:inner membrane protein involved in colicin E2 resistance
MPTRIQPGELSSELSLSAPISLFFFFAVLFVVALLRKIDIHPINYLFLAASFFAFHLLFAYSADHLTVVPAFVLSSLVSIILVVSYLRLVVSPQFAFREAAAAQLVYLIGFSLAHFWEGFTGLAVTVLAIVTLFVIMQATGRIRWSEVFTKPAPRGPATRPPGNRPNAAGSMAVSPQASAGMGA